MKLLRHPIRSIREPFGKAGLIVAIVALVAALGGSAIAAKGALTGKQKKEVQKIAKAEAKKLAKTGKAGAPGAQGPAGAPGAPGAKGDRGADGAPGGPGTSVTSEELNVGDENCEFGGSEFTSASGTTFACNGAEGPEGPAGADGSPWVADGLPSHKSEMGSWAVGEFTAESYVYEPISFTVPLAAGTTVTTHFINVLGEEETESANRGTSSACPGTFSNPIAEPGNLCIYEQNRSGAYLSTRGLSYEYAIPPQPQGGLNNVASSVGANLVLYTEPHGYARGDWVVTAP